MFGRTCRSPGHAFYDRLPDLLQVAGFDGFVEGVCKPYYKFNSSSIRKSVDRVGGIDSHRRVKTNRNFLSAADRWDLVKIARDGLEGHRIARRANALIDRDRGTPHDVTPPTPPGIRVRTTAVRSS